MDIMELTGKMNWVPRGIMDVTEKYMHKIPAVRREIQKQQDKVMQELGGSTKPYSRDFPTFTELPAVGRDREVILKEMEGMKAREEARWKDGFVSGAVYHGDAEHIEFLNKAYAINSQTNPLHSDLWPSINKYEAEIISMTANMLGAKDAAAQGTGEICGSVSSGGTESILLAMKTYRDWALETKGIRHPDMVVPSTAHAAFDKAAQYFKIKMKRIPVGPYFRADVGAMERAITRNTIALVGSAISFPHGVIDPIQELSELARSRGIGFHTDACLGGFILPFAKKLDYPVPAFDFSLPGVTSMSADTHKFGYAAKGTSVVLYRGTDLRHYQYYTVTDWPGGLYFSPTFAGSRPGGLAAAGWAALVSIGEEGYMKATKSILETAAEIKQGINSIPELKILGDPLWVIALASDSLDIYRVLDQMTKRHWNLNGLHRPPSVHICVTLRHTQPGVADRFVRDLKDSVEHVKANPDEKGGMAPVYGMAATLPVKGVISDLLKKYMDVLYDTKG